MLLRLIITGMVSLFATSALAREDLPRQLGELVLGQAAPPKYLIDDGAKSAVKVNYAEESALSKMWMDLAPGMPNAVELATIFSYRGRVAKVRFALKHEVGFDAAYRYLEHRFGKGRQAKIRHSYPAAEADCPRLFLLQNWASESRLLTLLWSSGGLYAVLNNELDDEMDRDPEAAFEGEGRCDGPKNLR